MTVDHALPRHERLRVSPPLPPDDVAFLAGFGRHQVPAHGTAGRQPRPCVGRIWPGQPPGPCPWVPCARGCCLHLAGATEAATAAAWLRFLLAHFLEESHSLEGAVEVPGRGRARAVLIVDRAEVFEGELDDGPDGRAGTPWSG